MLPIQVFYDGHCGLCRRTVRILRRLDWLHRLTFIDFQDGAMRERFAPDIPYERLNRALHIRLPDGTLHEGFFAFRNMCWSIPLLWVLAPLLYLPGVPWIGKKIYARIAARRAQCTHEHCAR